jgi:Family of unknown function (DUF6263)
MRYFTVVLAVSLLFAPWPSTFLHAQEDAKTESPIVKLLEAGSSPKKTLRLQPKKGEKQTSLLTMKMKQSLVVNGMKIPVPGAPPMQFTIEVIVTDVNKNEINFEYKYTKVEVLDDVKNPSPVAALVKQQIEPLVGTSGSCTFTDRGFSVKHDLTLPEGVGGPMRATLDSLKDSMSRLGSPLPEEPIGIGAQWSVEQNIAANGVKLVQTSTHTLKSIDGPTYTIDVAITQTAKPQKMQPPGLPPGSSVDLEALDSSGKGKMELNTTSVFPNSDIGIDSKMKMKLEIGGQAQEMEAETKMEMTIGSDAKDSTATKK